MQTHTVTARTSLHSLGILSVIVVGLGLATAIIHVTLISDEFAKGATVYGTLFSLTAIGYILALTAMYAPIDALEPYRMPARLLLIAIAVAAIVAYISLGYFDSLGWVTKVIEAALVIAALAEIPIQRRQR